MSDFKITGPGFYKARCGMKIEVVGRRCSPNATFPWVGFGNGGEGGGAIAWRDDGTYSSTFDSLDIIAPWTEPKKGTVWVNVYDYGCLSYGAFETREAADDTPAKRNRIACIEFNWTEGEGLS